MEHKLIYEPARLPVILIGAGGQALSVVDSLDKELYKVAGFIDEKKHGRFLDYPILGSKIEQIPNREQYLYFVCIGNNEDRKKWFEAISKSGLETMNVIDETASVSEMAQIGTGNFVGKYAVVNAGSVVGDNNLINTFALVEHECRIGSHTNLSTNCTLNGDVFVGDGAYFGSCAVCNGQINIGRFSIVGSGSVVTKDVPPFESVVGVPARPLKRCTG